MRLWFSCKSYLLEWLEALYNTEELKNIIGKETIVLVDIQEIE